MCVKLFMVVLKSRQVNLSVMLLLNLFINLFVFVNSLVYLCLLKASLALSYLVVKRCDFDLDNKVIINTRCSVNVCRKVRKSALLSVSTNVFHASASGVVNIKIVPPYQHFNSTKNVSKSVLSALAVSFIPVPTLTVNPAMSLHVRNVLMSVNITCRVRKVNLYIPLSVNTSTTLVDDDSHNITSCSVSEVCVFQV